MIKLCVYILAAASLVAQTPTINPSPSREFGQPQLAPQGLTSIAPNLVEGRELNGPFSIAVDSSGATPIIYIADTFNNRVLAWKMGSLTNGKYADLVIGQRDLLSTLPRGPGTSLSTGLSFPTSVAVDAKGNLYVLDAGNNRILRYPAPFSQSTQLLQVDLVIGQVSISSGSLANQGQAVPSSQTLAFSNGGAQRGGIAIDPQGNLWVSDALNNRVLEFPVASLSANTPQPSASLVLGQQSFSSSTPQYGQNNTQTNLSLLVQPSSLAFDPSGNLYVADAYARVMYFPSPIAPSSSASRLLGVVIQVQGQPTITYPNQYSLGTQTSGAISANLGVFTSADGRIFVCDGTANRIVIYDPPSTWTAASAQVPSPQIQGVIGQTGFTSGKANAGQPSPDGTTLALPLAGAAVGNAIIVVDSGNNRVLSLPQVTTHTYGAASVVLGQLDFPYSSVNLIVGGEVNFTGGPLESGGVAIDRNSNPPRLYVADPGNNRILGFKDARSVKPGQIADLVIGQPDVYHALINYPSNNVNTPNQSGLFSPAGVAVDTKGNLYVTDTGNGRVLRFPSPFQAAPGLPQANLILGQSSFTSPPDKDASSQTMSEPIGVVVLNAGHLAVSDSALNRVLVFFLPSGGDFQQDQSANLVLGQSGFESGASGGGPNDLSHMNQPLHIGVDSGDRLYVCDSSNNRVMIFGGTVGLANGGSASFTLPGLANPQGIAISQATGQFWVATAGGTPQIILFPEYVTLTLNPSQVNDVISLQTPAVDIGLDPFDDPVVAEAANRVTFFFPELIFQNAASYNSTTLAPGMFSYIYRVGSAFNFTTAAPQGSPWPTTMSGLQVLMNGAAVPLYEVLPTRVDFVVPQGAPTSGTADFQVVDVNSGQIYADSQLQMAPANPGFFTSNQGGTGQIAALNQDNTVNSTTNQVARGQVIQLFLTGMGVTPGAPPDGTAASAATSTAQPPQVYIAGASSSFIPQTDVQYAGLAPGFVGLYQLNVLVPMTVPPGPAVQVLVDIYNVPSNQGPVNSNNQIITLTTTIAVK